ncbi:MAG: glycosyltransferase family 1 protein [Candidatus Chloroheliales bacterium]|nr:MAG: glycosyltransferase family 1 protein [Chloroflexota bacterium]
MRVVIIGLGGVSRTFYNWPERTLGRALVRRGHAVAAYGYLTDAPDMSRDEVIDGISVVRVPARIWGNRRFEAALAREARPDIVHIMHPRNPLAFTAARHYRRLGVPVVYTWLGPFHDEYLVDDRDAPYDAPPHFDRLIFNPATALRRALTNRRVKYTLRNFALHWPLKQASWWLPCSRHEAGVLEQMGIPPARTSVVPLWIDPAPYQQPPVPVPGVEGATRPWLLYIGQLTRRKCYDLVVEAMPRIVAACPTASFLFVTHNPAQREQLLQMAAQRGVSEHLRFLGRLSDEEKSTLMKQSDVYLYPSRYEGFGLPLLESMAAGVPLISSDIPVVNEIVQHEYNGLLTPYNDAPAIAAAALRLLHDDALRQQLIVGGHATLRERYAEDKLITKVESYYQRAIEFAHRQGGKLCASSSSAQPACWAAL